MEVADKGREVKCHSCRENVKSTVSLRGGCWDWEWNAGLCEDEGDLVRSSDGKGA